ALPAWRACLAAWEREAEALRREGDGNPFLPSPQRATEANLDAVQEEASPANRKGPHAMDGKTLVAGPVEELSAEMRAYLNGFAQAVCWRPLEDVSLPAGLWALEMLGKEAAVLREGVDGLVRWLVGRLEAAGGNLRWGTRVRSVKVRGRRVRGISVKEGRSRSTTPVEGVVVAGGEVSRLLPLGRLRAPRRRTVGTLVTCLLAVEEAVVPEPLAPLAAYYPSPDQPVLLLSHNPTSRHTLKEWPRRLLTVGWRAEASAANGLDLPEALPKRLERLLPFLPGRWELVPQDDATGSPLRHRPIPETDPRELTLATGVRGLVSAAHHLLPGMATTASLTLGVAAAESLLRGP
ncbi:MAG: FAD-dependent oxidoreductase, partial [Nitrospinota bacterium]